MTRRPGASMKRTLTIRAPVDKVFNYYTDPTKITEYWPSMVDVRDVKVENGRATSYKWTYKMAGMRLDGETTVTEYQRNKHIVFKNTSGINATNVIDFEAEGESTRLTEEMSYEIPLPLLGRFAERFLLRLNENEFETTHANLKARMESDAD